ncbi:hypothetical protein [Synechococcus sp. H70.2]|uniref:hypothetical protein n=1 Tax=unclassified Synechococcus TaxID=2626047 RepID=UPI0039C1DEE9
MEGKNPSRHHRHQDCPDPGPVRSLLPAPHAYTLWPDDLRLTPPHASQTLPVRQGIPRSPSFGFLSPAAGSLA